MLLAPNLLPSLGIDRRKHCVALGRQVDMRDFEPVGHGHCGGEYITASDHHNFVDPVLGCIGPCKTERSIEAGR